MMKFCFGANYTFKDAYLCRCRLEQTTVLKVLFDDNVRHGVKHDLDVLRVCGTGQMRVDLFHSLLHVKLLKLLLDISAGIIVRVWTWKSHIW